MATNNPRTVHRVRVTASVVDVPARKLDTGHTYAPDSMRIDYEWTVEPDGSRTSVQPYSEVYGPLVRQNGAVGVARRTERFYGMRHVPPWVAVAVATYDPRPPAV